MRNIVNIIIDLLTKKKFNFKILSNGLVRYILNLWFRAWQDGGISAIVWFKVDAETSMIVLRKLVVKYHIL